jgi:uncharacterized membrane protein YkvA (DUF1232 family)
MKAWFEGWKQHARKLQIEVYAIYLAYRDPRVPRYARVWAACVVGYAFSPIDLIPDFIPVIGYLDDLLIVPLGVALALKMIPVEVMAECRGQAAVAMGEGHPVNRAAAIVIVSIWVLLAALAIALALRRLK